jgi:bla regulator protein BlaR1
MISAIARAAVFLSGSIVLSILFKATIMLALGLVAARLAGRGRAALRHLILAASFGMLLTLPLIVTTGRGLVVEVPISTSGESMAPVAAAPSPQNGFPSTYGNAAFGGRESARFSTPPWQAMIGFVWVAGALMFLVPLAVNLWRMRRLRRTGLPWPELQQRMVSLAAECGIFRPVEVLNDEEIPAPLMCGFWHPSIMLPSDARGWNDVELRCALVHELEHVRRGDWAVQLMARAICACYWFHPMVWVAWRRLCLEAERACDDAVLHSGDHTDYAAQLVSLARRMSKAHAQPALGMANRSDLSKRISAVLDGTQHRGRAGHSAAASTLIAAGLVVLAITPLRAVAQSPRKPQSESAPKQTQARRPGPLDRALYEAAESGQVPEIGQLLNAGANANCALPGDGSPLIGAARKGHVAAVRLLLDRGADPNMPVPGDGNPLIMAAREGHTDVVILLLERGARIDEIVPSDENALIQASGSGQLEVVKLLLSRGANVNARVWVAENGPRDVGEWRSPLAMARKGRHAEVAAFLLSAGARE